jgi:hypothetical protein
MKTSFAVTVILAILLMGGLMALPSDAAGQVVVELFTSEGCSSCPPADALLMDLDQSGSNHQMNVIALGEHVDYWNQQGWTDRFSSPFFTQRQSDYASHFHLASAYTPQMVINGRLQMVGNNREEVYRGIAAASQKSPTAIVALQLENPNQLHIKAQAPDGKGFHVLLVITEDGLSSSISGGENGGRVLHHAAVVRDMRDLGAVSEGSFEKVIQVKTHRDWNPANLKLVVFVQDAHTREIVGASSVVYAK